MTPRQSLAEGIAAFARAVERTRRELDDYTTPMLDVCVTADGGEGQVRIAGNIGETPIAHCFALPGLGSLTGTDGLRLALAAWALTAAQAASVRPPRYTS